MKVLKKAAAVGGYLKRDPVLCAAMAAAVASAFFAPPSPEYFGYIDLRVLGLLLALMLVVAGLKSAGVFGLLMGKLLKAARNTRLLAAVLVGACFFCSMLVTNDVSLITFVPLSIMTLSEINRRELLIPVIVLQTVAANLGSMLTPLGNPQNLYLYSLSGMGAGEFLGVMAPPAIASFLLLAVCVMLIKPEKLPGALGSSAGKASAKSALLWTGMFVLCLLAVVRLIPYWAALALVVTAAAIVDRRLLFSADYGLLLTFIFFFIFVGNIKSIPAVSEALSGLVKGRELTAGILASQVISNVPAAILLPGFSANLRALLLGVNIGGLGTLIASMASVISFKLYAAEPDARKGRYLLVFTGLNLAFLAVLWALAAVWI